jgi:hypothetical protein
MVSQTAAAATAVISGAASAVSSVASAMSSTSSASSAGSSSSGQSMWSLVNQYQLLLMIPLLNVYLDNDFEFYISEFQVAALDFDFMKFIEYPYIDPLFEEQDYTQPELVFKNNGVESGSFIFHYYQLLKIISIIIGINILYDIIA